MTALIAIRIRFRSLNQNYKCKPYSSIQSATLELENFKSVSFGFIWIVSR